MKLKGLGKKELVGYFIKHREKVIEQTEEVKNIKYYK